MSGSSTSPHVFGKPPVDVAGTEASHGEAGQENIELDLLQLAIPDTVQDPGIMEEPQTEDASSANNTSSDQRVLTPGLGTLSLGLAPSGGLSANQRRARIPEEVPEPLRPATPARVAKPVLPRPYPPAITRVAKPVPPRPQLPPSPSRVAKPVPSIPQLPPIERVAKPVPPPRPLFPLRLPEPAEKPQLPPPRSPRSPH